MSRKSRGTPLEQPPAEIIRGAQIVAEYLAQEVPQFRDNPLSEALPPTLTPREITEYLLQLPPYSDKDREMSQVARLQMTETAREFFVPNGKHLTVYYAITNMIRRGYVRRNPVLWGYWKQVHENIESFLKAIKKKPFPNSRARGLALVGSGGTGKSTTVEKILQSLPQVITHTSYRDQDFIMKQLVWLKLDCPRNGSLRELCVNFFRAVDEILGTQFENRYVGNTHRTLEALIAGIARVAANQCLGIIVIDEIQDLSEARSGGDVTMVNFFVHLENAIGVPFVLIGTQDAIPILCAQFRQARRVSEQGYIVWDRMSEVEARADEFDDDMEEDDLEASAGIPDGPPAGQTGVNGQNKPASPDRVWKNFIETLWKYQYVKHERELKGNILEDKCAHALYAVSKGIPAVVQTVFVLTQQLAILNEEEKITPRLIRETVRMNQSVIEDLLGEARMKKPRELKPVGDLADLDQVYEWEDSADGGMAGASENNNTAAGTSSHDTDGISGVNTQSKSGSATAKSDVGLNLTSSSDKTSKSGSKLGQKRAALPKNDLPAPSSHAGKKTKSGSPRKPGKYNRSPDEYLKGR
jgi:hypothetical protein